MNFSLMVQWLWRWYIVIPALLLSAALAVGAWFLVGPTYERTATLLLVPGVSTASEQGGNPYFYLSGLTQAADVVVRAVGSENTRRDVERSYDGVTVDVSRDPTTAGPVILIVARGDSDANTTAVLGLMVQRTRTDLLNLQVSDRVSRSDQIQVRPITIDDHSTLRQRTRLVAAGGVGGFTLVVIVFAAVLIQVLRHRSKARPSGRRPPLKEVTSQWDGWHTSAAEEVAAEKVAAEEVAAEEVIAPPPDKVTAGAGSFGAS